MNSYGFLWAEAICNSCAYLIYSSIFFPRLPSPKKTPILLPDSQEMDWPSLVDTATRAILRGESQEDISNPEPVQQHSTL